MSVVPIRLPTEGTPRRTDQRALARSRAFVLPSLALLLVAVGGRYSLGRGGARSLDWLDLRVLGLALATPLVAIDLKRLRGRGSPLVHRDGWLVAAMLFFGYQVGSAVWAPRDARVSAFAIDVLCTAVLVLGLYLHARADPEPVLRRALWVIWGTGLVFALGALLLGGAGAQGRYAAFGGGPNVFVRLQILGLVATAALVALGARKSILLAVPLFIISAVLSGSRGGLVAGVLVGLVAVLTGGPRARRAGVVSLAAGAASVLAAFLFWAPAQSLITTRFVEQTTEQGYDSGRTQIWGGAIELFRQHAVLGSGLDGYYALVGRAAGVAYPHDYLLQVAAEGGLVALALLAVSIVLWVRSIRVAPRLGVGGRAMVVSAAFIALASLFSGDYYDARLAWCFAALAAAAAGRPRAVDPLSVGPPDQSSLARIATALPVR
jgi:O-antigen ligase